MYEQSSGNIVAYNSITHGGDGLFLWAGQSTMDTGQGGSNDNLFFRNDFSHAPTNGIEATFSRNRFHENRVEECWHGVWGGYSFESEWVANRFARNSEGMAIEHGQGNTIAANTFDGDEIGIRLWQNPSQDPDWGYPRHRDTRSRTYAITGNTFQGVKTAIQVRDTSDVAMHSNKFLDVGTTVALAGETPNFRTDPPGVISLAGDDRVLRAPLPGGMDAMIREGERRGRNTIIVDEWGPYDWKSPKLWPAGAPGDTPLRLRVLGPDGDWKVQSVRGATVTPQAGRVGGEITVTPSGTDPVDYHLALEYRGAEVVSPRGVRTPAGSPYLFDYSRFFVPIDWQVRFFEYDEGSHPVNNPQGFAKLIAGTPLKRLSMQRLDYISGRAVEEGVPRDRLAILAEGSATIPDGRYTLQVISDDGVRVWMDGAMIIDAWQPHESRVDTAVFAGGRRRFAVQYYEVTGFAELRFEIKKRD
jgi:hypothetical protein